MKELVEALASKVGISGREHELSNYAAELFRENGSVVSVDKFGNVSAFLDKGKSSTICFEAHIDEIGLIVTKVHDNSFLSFTSIGGVDPKTLPACEIIVHAVGGERLGIITSTPPHLQEADDKKALKMEDLYIDIGGDINGVSIGNYISFRSNNYNLLSGKYANKSLDNRAGAAVLVDLANRCKGKDLAYNVQFLLTVQEEVGCRGAEMSRLSEHVESVIVIDVTHGISPVVNENDGYPLDKLAIGVGPSISRELTERLKRACGESSYVMEVCAGNSSTTAWNFQVKNNGLPTGLISIPLRYMHTPNEVVDIGTCEKLVDALEGLLC